MRVLHQIFMSINDSILSYQLDVNGTLRAYGITDSSDIRLKENIENLEEGVLDELTQLEGIRFDWIDQDKYGDNRQIGLIAQDVEVIFPELVSTDEDGYKSIAYGKSTAVIIEAIKELREESLTNFTSNQETLEDQQESIDNLETNLNNLISIYNLDLETLEPRLSAIEDLITELNTTDSLIINQLNSHEERLSNLETALLTGENTLEAGILSLDEEGNISFEGIITAGKVLAKEVETEMVVAGEYTVANSDNEVEDQNTGSVTLLANETEILIENSKVQADSRIIVTPIGNTPVSWILSEKRENEGFVIKLQEACGSDISFDYWIVQVESEQ